MTSKIPEEIKADLRNEILNYKLKRELFQTMNREVKLAGCEVSILRLRLYNKLSKLGYTYGSRRKVISEITED